MAFSPMALFTGLAGARTSYLKGRREQDALNAEAERQRRLDTFNEYARSRQLAQTDNAQENAMERASLQAQNALEVQGLRNEVGRLNAEVNRETRNRATDQRGTQATMQYGPGGQGDRNNAASEQRVRITVDGANRRDNTIITLPDGSFGQVDATGRVTPLGGTPYNKPTGGGQRAAEAKAHNQKQLRVLDDAIKQVEMNPDAVGLKNFAPDAIVQRLPRRGYRDGVLARAGVADVGSLEIRDRSGAAVTASEFPRLQPFIPLTTDDAKTVLQKLRRMKTIIQEEIDAGNITEVGGGKPARPGDVP